MRERIEELLQRFQYEINSEVTRRTIVAQLDDMLQHSVHSSEIINFRVTDRSNPENLNFEIIIQPIHTPHFNIIDVSIHGSSIKTSPFVQNMGGVRWIPPFGINND